MQAKPTAVATVSPLVVMAKFFPRLSRGHGSRGGRGCVAPGCGGGSEGHFQDPGELAIGFLAEQAKRARR